MPIHGPVLLGFGDFFVGAAKAAVKPVAVAKGKVQLRKGKDTGKGSPHKGALVNLATVAHKAEEIAKKAMFSVAKYNHDAKVGQHSTAIPLAVTKIHGDGTVVLGAAPATSRVLTPKQKVAVAKHAKAIERHKMATKALNIAASKTHAAAKKSLSKVAKTARSFAKAIKAPTTRVHGMDEIGNEELLDTIDMIDEVLGDDASMYDPSMMDAGTAAPADPIDHTKYGAAGGLDASSGVVTDFNGNVLYDPNNDPAITPMPVPRGGTLSASDAQVVWQKMPADAIPYTGNPLVKNAVGSWQMFNDSDNNGSGWGHGFLYGMHEGGPHWIDRTRSDFGHKYSSGKRTQDIARESISMGYGPLIGNTGVGKDGTSQFANLQYAIDDDKWFWQGANCPPQYATSADQAITDANNAIIQTNTAAALATAAQMQKDAADRAEAQAKQDAAQALAEQQEISKEQLAESAEQSAANVAQSQQASQAAQLDVEAYKAQIPIAAAQDQQTVAAQQALIEQAGIWNDWAKSHPEEAVAQMNEAAAADEGSEDAEATADSGDVDSSMDDGSQRIEGDSDEGDEDY